MTMLTQLYQAISPRTSWFVFQYLTLRIRLHVLRKGVSGTNPNLGIGLRPSILFDREGSGCFGSLTEWQKKHANISLRFFHITLPQSLKHLEPIVSYQNMTYHDPSTFHGEKTSNQFTLYNKHRLHVALTVLWVLLGTNMENYCSWVTRNLKQTHFDGFCSCCCWLNHGNLRYPPKATPPKK